MAVWGRHFYGEKFILCWEDHHFAGFIGAVFVLAMYITSILHILYSFYVTKACMMDSIVCSKLSFPILAV